MGEPSRPEGLGPQDKTKTKARHIKRMRQRGISRSFTTVARHRQAMSAGPATIAPEGGMPCSGGTSPDQA